MPGRKDRTDSAKLKSQVFVLRVLGEGEEAELEHVNGGAFSNHDTLQAAFDEIVDLLDFQTPRRGRFRRH